MKIVGCGREWDNDLSTWKVIELRDLEVGTTVEEIGELISFLKDAQASLVTGGAEGSAFYATLPDATCSLEGVLLTLDIKTGE